MTFDLDRIEEGARLGDGQKPVVADTGEALWNYLDCENDEGYGCDEECCPGRQAALDSLRQLLAPATADKSRPPVSASELLALVEVVKAARQLVIEHDDGLGEPCEPAWSRLTVAVGAFSATAPDGAPQNPASPSPGAYEDEQKNAFGDGQKPVVSGDGQ